MAWVLAWVASAMVFSAGCATLAGIDDTSGDARTSDSVELTRVSIGAQVVSAPLDLSGLAATYLVASADNPAGFDRVPATTPGPGRWTADLADPAPLELTLPDATPPTPQQLSFPDRALRVPFAVLEHPGRTPAPMPAMLDLTVALDAPTTGSEQFQIFTVGSWSQRVVGQAELPTMDNPQQLGPLSYDFQSSTSLSGRPELDALTQQDRFFVLRYASNALTGMAEVPAFDQTGHDTLAATMAPVTADQTLDVLLTPSRLTGRYASVQPAVAGLQISWALTAAPGASVAQSLGPVLQSGMLAGSDVGVNVAYGNPFAPTWPAVLTVTTVETRVYTGGPLPVTLQAGMTQSLVPTEGLALTLPAGLPQVISLAGKPLSSDGQTLALPSSPVTVSFTSDTPVVGQPSATLYTLGVFDLVPDAAATGLEPHLVVMATGSDATFQIPPQTFQAGHRYTLRAASQLGSYPGIATGDLVTRELPFAQSFLDSGVIEVTP